MVLTPHEMDIYQEHFQPYGVTQFQFDRVMKMGRTKLIPAGEIISREGHPITSVRLVVSGKTRANVGGRHLTAIGSKKGNRFKNVGGDSGAWIGEMAFLQANWERDHVKNGSRTNLKKGGRNNVVLMENGGVVSSSSSGGGGGEDGGQKKSLGLTSIIKSGNHSQDDGTDSTTSKSLLSTVASEPNRFISTIVAVEEVEIIEWSFEEMQKLLKVSNDMQGALTRAMTAAIVGKVVNFMVSRQHAIPKWSTMLDNWRVRTDRFVNGEEEVEDEDDEEEKIMMAVHDASNRKRFGWR